MGLPLRLGALHGVIPEDVEVEVISPFLSRDGRPSGATELQEGVGLAVSGGGIGVSDQGIVRGLGIRRSI